MKPIEKELDITFNQINNLLNEISDANLKILTEKADSFWKRVKDLSKKCDDYLKRVENNKIAIATIKSMQKELEVCGDVIDFKFQTYD